jgi:hypothetical protein
MTLRLSDSLSLPGDSSKANEDAFAHGPAGAVVLDGATGLGEPLLPGTSDAAWIARFGARRLMTHLEAGLSGAQAVDAALSDAAHSFAGLARRPPQATWEMPFASMMFCVAVADGIEALWFGDCAAVIAVPGEDAFIVGETLASKGAERERVAQLAAQSGIAPTSGPGRAEFLPALRQARNRVNTKDGYFLFGPDEAALGRAQTRRLRLVPGTRILLASDGFLALVSDYGRYDLNGLIARAGDGLAELGAELRAIEHADPDGRAFPRFKQSDDATALFCAFD